MSQLERGDDLRIRLPEGGLYLGGGDRQAQLPRVDAVKTQAEVVQGLIAAGANLLDDRTHIGLDVFGDLTLGAQERGEPALEIRLPAIKPQYQCPAPISHYDILFSRRPDGGA